MLVEPGWPAVLRLGVRAGSQAPGYGAVPDPRTTVMNPQTVTDGQRRPRWPMR